MKCEHSARKSGSAHFMALEISVGREDAAR